MSHRANPRFWVCYEALPSEVRRLADENYALLRSNQHHPSLQYKRIGRFRSVRVGLHYRALAVEADGDVIWFWIGHHAEYDRLIAGR